MVELKDKAWVRNGSGYLLNVFDTQ